MTACRRDANEKKSRLVALHLLRTHDLAKRSVGLLLGGEDIAGSEACRHRRESLPCL